MKRKTSLIALLLCIVCLCSCTVGGGMEIPTVSVLDSYFSESEEDPTTVPTTDEVTTEETTTSKGTPETEESTSTEAQSSRGRFVRCVELCNGWYSFLFHVFL